MIRLKSNPIIFMIGAVVFFIGCLSVFGYLFGIVLLYNWTAIAIPGSSQMALNTAIAMLFVGLDLILIAREL